MYRCTSCDAPAQSGCKCAEERTKIFDKAMAALDPWADWKEHERKLDIQAGVHVNVKEGVISG